MNEEMFETLSLDAEAWTRHARGLYRSGMCLVMPIEKEMRVLLEEGQGTSEHYVEAGDNFVGYCLSSGLLFGLAIEVAYKTRKIIEGQITVKEGKLVGLRRGHDISKMVQEFNIELGPEEQLAVDSITCVVKDLGKYPVAKSAEVQSKFGDRFYGAEYVQRLAKRIIMTLLKEKHYIRIFTHERLGDVLGPGSG